jgi:hypothetical protein
MGLVIAVCWFNQPRIIPGSLSQVLHEIRVKHPYQCGIDFVFLNIIFQCPISHSNIIFYIYRFHLSLIHCWIQIQVFRSFSSHFHNSKLTLAMGNLCFHHVSFSLYIIIKDVCVSFVFIIF